MKKVKFNLPIVNINDDFDDDGFSSVSQQDDENKKIAPYAPVAVNLKRSLDSSFKQAKQVLTTAQMPQQKNIGTQAKKKLQACKEGFDNIDPKKVIKEMTEINAIVQEASEFLATAENWEDIASLETATEAMGEACAIFNDDKLEDVDVKQM